MPFVYDNNKTAAENLADYEALMAADGYVLGSIEGTPETDSLKFMELRSLAAQETKKIADFGVAKQAAFDALAATHDQEKTDLGVLWQAKEDNGYDVNFTP